jgi:hypothetical protein
MSPVAKGARCYRRRQAAGIAGGTYKIVLAKSADAPVITAEAQVQSRLLGN